jgi:hypothetical protein
MTTDKNPDNEIRQNHEAILKFKMDELKIRVDTYQKYINITLQVNAFYYAITGGVLGVYLNRPDGQLVYFLLLPIFMGGILGGILLHGANLQKNASGKIQAILTKLNDEPIKQDIKPIDDIDLLRQLLLIFGFTFLLVGTALTVMPIIRELIRSSHVPFYLIVFVVLALCALILGGCARLLVAWIFDRTNKPENTDEE